MRRYISRRKLLHKMKEICVSSHMMDDLTVVKYQVDETQLLIYIIYTYEYILPYLQYHSKMTTLLASLLRVLNKTSIQILFK